MKHVDVLIIDDEVKFAGMLSKRLALRGVVCHRCYDGTSGLKFLSESDFKGNPLVLLDLNLPDIYGTQVMTKIKKMNPDIRVVIVTGHGTDSDRIECIRLGAFDFVNKPVKIDQILSFLEWQQEEKA
jgi:DNA-binding NtrC family response regulator